jgi:translation initiation factor IF-3
MVIQQQPQTQREIRINHRIRIAQVRLVGSDGSQIGIVPTHEALRLAKEESLDLVEVNPRSTPPVCKIMDFGKYKYEEKKKNQEIRRNQVVIETKEIKLRPVIDRHDLDIKVVQIKQFLEDKNKVKITVRFKGREVMHSQLGMDLLTVIVQEVGTMAVVEFKPLLEGKAITMILAPSNG